MLIGHELGDADMDGLLPQHSPTFQFENPFLINLSRTIGDEVSTLVEPTIGLFSGFSLIVGAIVGAGIFSSPGPVLLHSGGMLPSLVIWLLAGLLSLCGALSYAELGTAYPSSGGEHHYLMKAYGPIAAFLYSLTGVILVRPASQAIIFTVAGEYLYRIASFGSTIIYAVGLLSALTILNIISTKSSTATQDILTSLKLFVLLLIISLGFSKITTSHKFHLFDENSVEKQPGGYALAFYFALWAYDGWNNLNFITSELVDPANTLPTCISISMITVIVSYILANISYFLVLSIPDIQSSASLALDFGYSTLGKNAGIIIPIVVVLSAMGAANASLFTGSRLIVVVSQQGHIPEFLSGINKITKTPIFALGMQYFLCVAYIIVGDLHSLLKVFSITSLIFYVSTVTGLIVLRIKDPHVPRPWKVHLALPYTFSLITSIILLLSVWQSPKEAAASIIMTLCGIPIYYVSKITNPWLNKFHDYIQGNRLDSDIVLEMTGLGIPEAET